MSQTVNHPNILLIMTDQQRYDSLGCYGSKAVPTPNLDALAAQGAVFENCYVNNPVCTPSRASMMTGRPLPGHGVYRLYDNLPPDQVLFPKILNEGGYHTALFGKMHVSSNAQEAAERHPTDGFDVYEWCNEGCFFMDSPYHGYSRWLQNNHPGFYSRLKEEKRNLTHIEEQYQVNRWATDSTLHFIKNCPKNQPFFCMMSLFDPHDPYDRHPKEWENAVNLDQLPDPILPPLEMEGKPAVLQRTSRSSYLGPFSDYSAEALRKMRVGYYASVAYLDSEVGRLMEGLAESGLAENTLVIFTSDHGDMLGDHYQLVKGGCFYDPSVRVPLIMRWPTKIPAGVRISSLVQNHDLAATILSAAGLKTSDSSALMPESKDMGALTQRNTDTLHDAVFCCLRNTTLSSEPSGAPYYDPPIHGTMVRAGKYKMNFWHFTGTEDPEPAGELYHMEADPGEMVNLWNAPEHQEARARLTELLAQWLWRQEMYTASRGGETVPANRRKGGGGPPA